MEASAGRRALITGISGQDGSYLAELLLSKGYEVHGTVRRPLPTGFERLEHLRTAIALHEMELSEHDRLTDLLRDSRPDEIYNLAAMSSAVDSWNQPIAAGETAGMAVTRLLEAVREVTPRARLFQASSSEVFRGAEEEPQNELTAIHPTNPYGAAKAHAQFVTACYREHHGLFACSGILFNHESPRRGVDFVTRKVTRTAAAIKLGLEHELALGDLDAARDWGFAGDYVRAMWLMLQAEEPRDYVVATGELHSVRELVSIAFDRVGLEPDRYVTVDSRYIRRAETRNLVGDPSKIQVVLGWRPSTSFSALVRMMVDSDLEALAGDRPLA